MPNRTVLQVLLLPGANDEREFVNQVSDDLRSYGATRTARGLRLADGAHFALVMGRFGSEAEAACAGEKMMNKWRDTVALKICDLSKEDVNFEPGPEIYALLAEQHPGLLLAVDDRRRLQEYQHRMN